MIKCKSNRARIYPVLQKLPTDAQAHEATIGFAPDANLYEVGIRIEGSYFRVRELENYELENQNWEVEIHQTQTPLSRNSVGAQPTRLAHTHWNSTQFHGDSKHYDLHVAHMVPLITSEVKLSRAFVFDSCSTICQVLSAPAIYWET